MTENSKRKLTIPPPRADRPPLQNNVFYALQRSNTTLLPLFPHFYPGAMVPAVAVLSGGPGKQYSQFRHYNSVDEVVFTFGADGALLKTGQVFVGGRVHGVDSFLKDESNPDSFAIFCITQRQAESGPQVEAIAMQCEECREEFFKYEVDVTPTPDANEKDEPFPTLAISLDAFVDYNADPAVRTCPSCGHVNGPFPVAAWGWPQYMGQTTTVFTGKDHLRNAGSGAMSSAGGSPGQGG